MARPATAARRSPAKRKNRIREIVVAVILIPVCLIWIYPFLWLLSASVKSNAQVFGGLNLFTHVVQLGNYVRAWNQANVGRYFINTSLITGGSIIITVISVALMGYVLGRYRFRGKKIVAGLLAAAIFLPEGYTIIPTLDLLNKLHLQSSLWGLTLAESGGVQVMMILLFAGYFSQLPGELEEAAIMDGAGFVRVFAQIYLPLTKPVIATCVILQFMHAWNDFLLPLVVTLNKPNLRTLSVGIYSFQGQYFTDYSGMAAAAVIGLAPIVILFLVLQRYFVEGIAGAVKQ
ncbi:MAG TPA: carbohydrate ABC transporter permease [Mycobacteriales bacterium]|nr:carbohydrate ABC transporter permease [Mycobacteriales bacterium]